jgi:MscS family membrane protein
VYVPNSFFAQTAIENPSRMENRRIKHFINLPYKDFDKIPGILEEIKKELKNSQDIDQNKQIWVHITRLADSSVECMVYCFTKYTDWERFLDAQQKVMLTILAIVHQYETSYGLPLSHVIIQHIDK